jgi:hypothetical protein
MASSSMVRYAAAIAVCEPDSMGAAGWRSEQEWALLATASTQWLACPLVLGLLLLRRAEVK